MNRWMILLMTFLATEIHAQEPPLLIRYRTRVKEYSQDIKSAEYAIYIQQEREKSAKADFLPGLSAEANFNYTGNPRELNLVVPDLNEHLSFRGKESRYGTAVTLSQPLYSGGKIKAGYDKAKRENEMAKYEKERISSDIIHDADIRYWNKVAKEEIAHVTEEFRKAVENLVLVIQSRVDEEYTDKSDLLMAQVKLNEADYQMIQAKNEAEIARMNMNSLAGIPFSDTIPTDTFVIPLTETVPHTLSLEKAVENRAEWKISEQKIGILKQEARIAQAAYLPWISVGIDGSYSSPGYDFKADWDPNYAIYAKLKVPVFEWGKRRNTREEGRHSVNRAIENHDKVEDCIKLDIETAFYEYQQAVQKVLLTENSLGKASENEKMALEKYWEGDISIVEVIDAQLYCQNAKMNYIHSKLNAQIARSKLARATGETVME